MSTSHLWVRKNLLLVLASLWTIAIAVLCLIDANELPKPELDIKSPDKYVHFTFHFVFSMLWIAYGFRQHWKNIFIKVLLGSIAFGIIIEICQELFTTTRSADIKDVLANTAGAVAAIILLKIFRKPASTVVQ